MSAKSYPNPNDPEKLPKGEIMNAITPTNQTDIVLSSGLPLDQNPAAVYIASLESQGSKRTQRQALDTIAALLLGADLESDAVKNLCLSVDWSALRYQHTTAIRSMLAKDRAAATANRMLSAMRQTLYQAWKLGQMSAEEYHRARDVKNIKGETLAAGRDLSSGEIVGLMTVCINDLTPAGVRDATIISMLYTCGLRRSEVVTLNLEDCEYLPEDEQYKLTIRGKRNKERTAYLDNGAAGAMSDWLLLRGDEPGALFRAINKGGKIRKGRMTSQAIYNMLSKRAEEAGVREFSPHDLRRTFVGDQLDAGTDISMVAKMAGHASTNTTARYDRRDEREKQKAASRLHVPYRRRML